MNAEIKPRGMTSYQPKERNSLNIWGIREPLLNKIPITQNNETNIAPKPKMKL